MHIPPQDPQHIGRGIVAGVSKQLGGFQKFLLRGNVVDLAVGVVVGSAFSNVVQTLVKSLITPLLGLFGSGPDLSNWTLQAGGQLFRVGDVMNAILSFVLISAVIYFFVVLPTNRLIEQFQPNSTPPMRDCPECLSSIPAAARRCRACGSVIEHAANDG